ncbi:MAG: Ribosomal RNA large subunit methyltransferase I [Syntrophorhabdaceae bacterium PtaU1.Bin034]|nr:MAG: Ribosomal RNA large subunit methyltransferase I [Syntrophorhabdaceae bacterium PtaU1.Bin034]
MEQVRVDRSAEESVVAGHLWIFSNQIKERPADFIDGGLVEVWSERNKFLGVGYYNSRSLIAVRLLSRNRVNIDDTFFLVRIEDALRLRAGDYEESFRVVNSESDFLPGLIIDKYGEQIAVQLLTFGMERQRDAIISAVKKVFSPRAIVLRNDSPSRQEEGLPQYVEVAEGSVNRHAVIKVGPLRFLVDVLSGHKTGFYFDQRDNRLLMKSYAPGQKVLDLFSYTGGFGLYALHFGARSVTFVDASAQALDICKENARLNGLKGGTFVRIDGFDFLKATDEQYQLMVLDPPSFIKSKKKLKEGEKGYIDLHKKALRKVSDNGHLFSFSCSFHMRRSRFRDIMRIAAYGFADVYLIRELSQAGDHPVLLTVPETDYLKGLVVRVKKRL